MRIGSRNRAVAAAALLAAVATGSAQACDAIVYDCILSGLQEEPDVASPAVGGGQFLIDTDANTVTYHISYHGLTSAETAAHIHGFADPGVGAGVVHGLPAGSPKVGVWNYDEADEADILAGRAYVNVHTSDHTGGELRGQIVPLNASLTGDQEDPPIATGGAGFGVFTIDIPNNMLTYHIEFSGLSSAETAAHIHGPALHGTNTGVAFGLGTGNPKTGTWNYPDNLEQDILNGRMYVNIHSTDHGGGEIRGQIVPTVVPIDGGQENPPIDTPAAGIGLFAMNHDTDELSYDIRHSGLSAAETAAHIHGFAPPDMNAGVIHGLGTGSPKIGVYAYDDADEQSLLDGLAYINIHTSAHTGGEVRGQMTALPCPLPAVAVGEPSVVTLLRLAGNAPNPFGPRTTISFDLDRGTHVSLVIFDASGRLVRRLLDTTLDAGAHGVEWDALDVDGNPVANGVYHYVLDTPEGSVADRMTVVR